MGDYLLFHWFNEGRLWGLGYILKQKKDLVVIIKAYPFK